MRKLGQLFVFGACAALFVATGVATCVWVTIPPALDPDALPSQAVEIASPDFAEPIDRARIIARELTAEEKLPGLSLAVAVDGAIVWAEGFGWADIDRKQPVSPATQFRIGGISESLTAAAVGLLHQRGRLDLNAPVQRYVPSFPEKKGPMSTRQLMAHTSGIRPYRGDGGIFRGSCRDDAERLALFAGEPLRSRPGTEFGYSTFGWSLVGAVVGAVADEPYLEFMQREVFAPLAMSATAPAVADGPAHARFYYPRLMLNPRYGLHDAPEVDLSCHLPAVGFVSTPSDLARFGAAMMDGTLLGTDTVSALQSEQLIEAGEPTGRALGWMIGRVPVGDQNDSIRVVGQGLGETVVRHALGARTVGGQVAGATTTLITVPDRRIAIAVTTNVSGSDNVSVLAAQIAKMFVTHERAR